jgi:hypothetical protein
MKIESCFKITTKDNKSCICDFGSVRADVKSAYGITYSTEHWILPNPGLLHSGIFVFKDMSDLRLFWKYCSMRSPKFVVWEALGFHIRPKKMVLEVHTDFEWWDKFWRFPALCKRYVNEMYVGGFFIADGVKLIKQIDINS